MKGKNLKQLINNQKAKRVGCILLAAAVLGTGAWAVDNGQKSDTGKHGAVCCRGKSL